MTFNAVIFDLFGTLIDLYTEEAEQKVLLDIAKTLSLPAGPFQKLWAETYPHRVTGLFHDDASYMLNLCKRLEVVPCESSLKAAIELKNEFTQGLMVPRPDAEQTLKKLKRLGLRLALLTNSSREVPLYWNKTSLAPLMDAAIFSCEVKLRKPDTAVYDLTCERLDESPQDCLFVGDGGNRELEAAEEVGMTAVMIRTPDDAIFNPRRTASDNWSGLRISCLTEVVPIASGA